MTTDQRTKQRRDFEQFMNAVDSQLLQRVGLRHTQCADYSWFQAFDKGQTVRATINHFLSDKDF